MSNMSYCRHENTARDLQDVWEHWFEDEEGKEYTFNDLNEYEQRGRNRIIRLVQEMYEQFESDGEYDS